MAEGQIPQSLCQTWNSSLISALYIYVFTSNHYGLSSSVPSGASCVVGPDLHVYLSFCHQNIESGS